MLTHSNPKFILVIRQKSNALYIVLKTINVTVLAPKQAGVVKKEEIEVNYKKKKVLITLLLREICFQDEKSRLFVMCCNNFIITALEQNQRLIPAPVVNCYSCIIPNRPG